MGIGPGKKEFISDRARQCITTSQVVVGYKAYIDLITDLTADDQRVISSGMTREVERCQQVINLAAAGKTVSLVSSGDPGIYGMAGILYQMLDKADADIGVEVVPGITAANAAAASLGAPLMHDFACISLSDLLTPWSTIIKRVEMAARGDFVIALYNPKSKKRVKQIEEVRQLLLTVVSPDTPVGIVRNAKREGEEVTLSNLKEFTHHEIDMFTTVIIGNSQTYVAGKQMITPRGYRV